MVESGNAAAKVGQSHCQSVRDKRRQTQPEVSCFHAGTVGGTDGKGMLLFAMKKTAYRLYRGVVSATALDKGLSLIVALKGYAAQHAILKISRCDIHCQSAVGYATAPIMMAHAIGDDTTRF